MYNVWGTIIAVTDGNDNDISSNTTHIANINPIRYRGYYYDTETGFYYLQSRYYDPEICRFINADGQLSIGSDMNGMNLFAYCGNNPVNRIDPTGEAWWHVAVACLAVAAVCAVAVAAAPVLAAAAVGAGIATTASSIAMAAYATGTVATVIGISACGTGIAKTISKSKSSSKSTAKAKEKDITAPPSPTVIYRYGGTNPGNLTPRQKDKYTGLSFSTKPMPGAAMTTLEELNSTGVVYAVRDGATHVSVRPIGGTMDDWINAGSNSIWTQAVKSVVVKWDGDN